MSGFTGWKEEPDSCLDFLTRSDVPLIARYSKRKAGKVSEKDALQNAADEARKVARAAREFSRLLDDYAKYLTQPNWQERAVELHLSALNKLSAINAGLITCDNWIAESSKSVVAQPSEQAIKSGVSEKQDVLEPSRPRSMQIRKKGSMEWGNIQ
jgi:hypothetical protein